MEGTNLDDLINLEGTVRGTIFSGSHKCIVAQQSISNILKGAGSSVLFTFLRF